MTARRARVLKGQACVTSSRSAACWSAASSSGVLLGLLLDAWWGTSPAFVLAGTALGIVAAGTGFWLRVRTFLRG